MNRNEPFYLELKDVEIVIGQRILLKEAYFSLNRGEWALLLGSNGSGKTTLLKLIAGRWSSWSGKLIVNGREYTHSNWNSLTAYQNGITILDQLPELPDNLRVWEYLSWGLGEGVNSLFLKSSSLNTLIKEKIKSDFFSSLSLEGFLKDLKEGDRFKLLILSAILRAKNLILWDESTIFFNTKEKESLFKLIELLREEGLAHLMVTHESFIKEKESLKKFFIENKTLSIKEEFSQIIFDHQISFSPKESYSSLLNINLDGLALNINKGEIFALISEKESSLRNIENKIMGNNKLKKGESLILEKENISSLSFYQRRKRIGYVKAWLGIKEEPAFYSLLFPSLFKSKQFFINEKGLILKAKEMVAPSFYKRLLTPWKFLSGGEKQSLILEREINNNPSFLLVPFPFQGLDRKAIENFKRKLKEFSLSGGVLILTTEVKEVSSIANQLIFIDDL